MTMNRLKFNEGGQPVYVDDLETLQENDFGMRKAMLSVMTMGSKAFLLSDVDQERGDNNQVKIGSGTVVIDGMLCPFEGKTLKAKTNESVFLLVKRFETDERVFENGQTKACAETITAALGTETAGAAEAYKLDELETFLDLLTKAIESNRMKGNTDVMFFNGYSGRVKLMKSDDGTDTEMVIDIKSGNINWDGGAQAYKGLLFRIDDEELAVPFRGKGSKKFNYSGTDYRIIVAAEPMAAVVSIELGSGRDNFYEDSYVLPLIPIKATFKASEFTDF